MKRFLTISQGTRRGAMRRLSDRLQSRARIRGTRFARDEDGAMIIFGVMLFGLILAISGLSFDLMRYEAHRERLQATLDRAVLAAASLTQTLDPATVVLDYFAKAGMSNYIDASNINVVAGVNFRRVEATAHIHVPLHHGTFTVFTGEGSSNNTLIAEATSIAQESIGNVEISLVLDVSGSMNRYNRLTNLKAAAKGFIDTIYDASEAGAVSTSIIPYATQVNAGEVLLSYFNRRDSHEHSHCINFQSPDFASTSISTLTELEQTVHFDPWTDENNTYGFDLGDPLPYPVCPGEAHREILPWSGNRTALKNYIDALTATGNTSTDIGMKWGAALIDPSLQPVLAGMIASGDVDGNLVGRPFTYADDDALKIVVVMTDGAHTSQYYMDQNRTGDSFVWRYEEGGVVHYSIWWDGTGSTPITNPSGSYTYCDDWNNGSCEDWDTGTDPEFWFHARSYDGISNTYSWRSAPYGGANAVRMDWNDVWAEIPPEYFSDEVLWRMGSLSSGERNAYENSVDYVGKSTKDSRFDTVCSAVKANDAIIFSIGLEVTSDNATRLRNCASSASHYYDVDNLDIDLAFQSIASAINQLRLIQ